MFWRPKDSSKGIDTLFGSYKQKTKHLECKLELLE